MSHFYKKRMALVLKMTIVIGCGSVLASCGNAQNKNGQAQMYAALQQKMAALQGKASQINPTTGQPANTPTTGNLISGTNGNVWASDCIQSTTPGTDTYGKQIQSYGEVYMFVGTAWFAEFGFWEDNQCGGSNGGTMSQPQSWTNNFGAGYVQGMPNITTAPWSGQLSLVAWDSTTAIGNGIGLTSFQGGLSPQGNSFTLTVNLQAGPQTQAPDTQASGMNDGSQGSGSMVVTDIATNPNGQIQLQIYNAATSPY